MNNKAFDHIINQKLHSYSAPVPAGLWDKIAAKDLSEPNDPFDEFVHQKLYHHSAEVSNQLWDKIQTAFIPQEEKRRRFIFWLPQQYRVAASILLVLLIGTVAAYLYDYSFQSEKIDGASPVQVQQSGSLNEPESVKDNPNKQEDTKNKQNTVGTEDKSAIDSGIVAEGEADTEKAINSAAETNKTEKVRNRTAWKLDRKNKTASFRERGSVFVVSKILNRYTNRVKIAGAVYRPDVFELTSNLKVADLIRKADGLTEDAYTGRAQIIRLQEDLTRSVVSFDVTKALNGDAANNILLNREDEVIITSKLDLRDSLNVYIQGEIRKPGSFEFTQGLTLKDLILQAGGLTDAAFKSIEIARLIKRDSIEQKDFRAACNIKGKEAWFVTSKFSKWLTRKKFTDIIESFYISDWVS